MRYEKRTFVDKARACWGDPPPSWIMALAEEADRTNSRRAAKLIGYSNAVVSYVISNKYPGDIARVQEKVQGALQGLTVTCPVYGEMGRDQCLDFQKVTPPFSSGASAMCYQYCRGLSRPKCPNSRIPDGQR